eukprot:CAMPEP_0198313584 /NCGR_PEP_ID=MMETSP1450-20131203/4554_1 /TAXON_ID=753684 ORGANISM="Madagascaria erythrocladiodes, Strain CCMP3234" /NCGR_SAMPLE_ID=MMETSP1450 /ASSEMBLY_ACC=CAM_ASM_001115 /LENGTH=342 /DNA_ID=CAMNT_0044016593 /DNA_START=143 /DNA_END=1171 /DNA_ORIENTATION=-
MAPSLLFLHTPPTGPVTPTTARLASTSRWPTPRLASQPRRASVTMAAGGGNPTSWDDYVKQRQSGGLQGGTMDEAKAGMQSFIDGGGDMEFDGGDSGGGVVGDGNTDLEDQHNSTEMLREGFGKKGGISNQTGGKVETAMHSRIASAGQNYFGRSTGYAEKKIETITEQDRKMNRMDNVRAQQLENWHNQRSIHQAKQGRREGVMFGSEEYTPFRIDKFAQTKADMKDKRRDGEDWGELKVEPWEEPTETFELRSPVNNTEVVEIQVTNPYISYAPFRCVFTEDSHPAFVARPDRGTMERRGGAPVEIVVRFTPRELMQPSTATLIFETEDFKNIYKFVGST